MALDALIKDYPEQFKGKKNIASIAKVLDRQLQEVYDVFASLAAQRSMSEAEGVQLDNAGDIVCLTRAEAGLLVGDPIYLEVMDDERYRKYLQYKAYKNSNDCTYYDLINELRLVWDVDQIQYEENPNFPATIILSAPLLTPSGEPANLGQIPAIKPAGVRVLYQYKARYVIQVSHEIGIVLFDLPVCGTLLCGTYPTTATLGKTSENGITASMGTGVYKNEYDLTGTIPETATLGKENVSGVMTDSDMLYWRNEHKFSGTKMTENDLGQTESENIHITDTTAFYKSEHPLTGTAVCGKTI